MTDNQIIEIVENEIRDQTLDVTQQYLNIHNPIFVGNKPIIERIDKERTNKLFIAYLPVQDQKFYFAVYLDPSTKEVVGFGTEPNNNIYFRATSDLLSEFQLKSMTKLTPTQSWNKGDPKKQGKLNISFSSLEFQPNPEPDEFEDKLKKLLDFLEQDTEGIRLLVEKANGYIQAVLYFHNGNGMIGGPTIEKESIRRLNNLNLEINFEIYLEGNKFKES